MEPYNFPFTRIKQVEKSLDEMADGEEEKKEEEEKKTEELTEEEAKSLDAQSSASTAATEEEKKYKSEGDKLVDKLSKPGKSINLEDIEEGDVGESNAQDGER